MSELVFTVFAQRLGVNVWHGHAADIQNTILSKDGDSVPIVRQSDKTKSVVSKSPLVVDGTGRFRQLASKAARVKRFENFNTDAFFGYFEALNEDAIPDVSLNHVFISLNPHDIPDFRNLKALKVATLVTYASPKVGCISFVCFLGMDPQWRTCST